MSDLIENRHIRIFISSTFRDMMDERDYLVTKVFPSLRSYCEKRDITLFELDLRWGITEEESKQGKVVETCLQEIKNTKPFFIGLLGERYGWVPDKSEQELIDKNSSVLSDYPWVRDELNNGTSITEIEIQEGVLRAKEKINAYFYFRSPQAEVPPEYTEKNGSQAARKLVNLKSKIQEQYPIVEFSSKEELGQFVEKDFKDMVNQLFPGRWISEFEKERVEQKSYFKRLTQVYIPRQIPEEAIDNFIKSKEKFLIITGESGMGKSALLANWVRKKEKEELGTKILYHFIGVTRLEGDSRKVRQRLINEVRKIFVIIQKFGQKPDNEPSISEELSADEKKKNELQNYLFAIPKDENLVIILDGIDKLTDKDNETFLNWLPACPENVKFIFSTPQDDPIMDVFNRMNYNIITIPALDIESRKRLITDYLLSFGKKLNSSQTDRIANDKESANPMILRALLDELRFFGIYEKLDEEIDKYLAAQNIPEFYVKVLERLENIFDYTDTEASNLSKDILSLLYVSRNGLSETEIIALTGAKPVYWSQIYSAMRSNLIVSGGLINFSHNYIKEAIKCRYFTEKNNENSYRLWLVHYLKTTLNVPEKRIYLELPYQLYNLGDQSGLYRFLKNSDAFTYWIKKDFYELGKYCRFLNEADKKKISSEIEKNLELEIKKSDKDELADLYYSTGMLVKVLDFDNSLSLKLIQQAMDVREDGESYYGIGMLHFDKGDYQNALDYYQKALNAFKGTSENKNLFLVLTYFGIGRIYQILDDYPQALEYYQKALNIFEGAFENKELYAKVNNNIGLVYYSMDNMQKALEYGQKALNIQEETLGKKNKDTATSYNNIGLVYSTLGDKEKAIDYFQQALNIHEEVLGKNHKDTALFYCNTGMGYSAIGDYPKALMYVEQALNIQKNILGEKHIDTALSYNNIGEINSLMGNYQKALECFQQSLNILKEIFGEEHPQTVFIRNNLIELYIILGTNTTEDDPDLAIELLTQAINLAPAEGKIYMVRAAAYYQKSGSDAAMADLKISADLGCKDAFEVTAKMILDKGDIHQKHKDYDRAIIEYSDAIKLNPNYTTAFNRRGNTYYSKKDYDKAITDYSQALMLNPNEAVYYSNRGGAYKWKGDYKNAIIDYTESIRLNPNDAGTYNQRGNIHYFIRSYDLAIEDYSQAIRLIPNEAVYYSNRGGAYKFKGDYGNAIMDYNEFLAITEKNPGGSHTDTGAAYDSIGLCYYSLGDRQKALEYYKEALTIYSSLEGQKAKTDTIKQVIAAVSNPNITLLASNVYAFEQAKEIIGKYTDQLEAEGYHFVDERGDKSGELYMEYTNLNTSIFSGQIYVYSPPHYRLIVSRGDELGILLSFTDLSP